MPRKSSQPPDDAEQLGLNLGSELSAKPEAKIEKSKKSSHKKQPGRIERVQARNLLETAIVAQNGNDECIADATIAISKTAFGVTPRKLYEIVGGKPGDRDTLPQEMQTKLIVHELTIAPRLDAEAIVGEDQEDINNQILHVVQRQSKETEQFLKQHNLYQGLVGKYRIAQAIEQSKLSESKTPSPNVMGEESLD
jgi:hypothetical protein